MFYAILALLLTIFVNARESEFTKLESGFKSPPNSVKPRTWYHAISGNMSREGITKDLVALAAEGEDGIPLFNVAQGILYGEITCNSTKHHNIIKHTANECYRLELTFGAHNCDVWSSGSRPCINPEKSIKMVVWCEILFVNGIQLILCRYFI